MTFFHTSPPDTGDSYGGGKGELPTNASSKHLEGGLEMAISALESPMLGVVSDAERSGSTSTSNASMNSEDFLILLCAQLENQDPLDPMDTDEMTSTLSNLNQLEQSIEMNEYLQELITYQSSVNNSMALQCIGKTVTAPGNVLYLEDGVSGQASYELACDAALVTVTFYDESGNAVRTLGMNQVSEGSHALSWDGAGDSGETLPNGAYTFEVAAYDSNGETVEVTTSVACQVTGVEYVDGVPYLITANGSIAYGTVTGVSAG